MPSVALRVLGALFAVFVASAPAAALEAINGAPANNGVAQRADPIPRVVEVPGYGTVLVVQQPQKDNRSDRQRCVDEEVAREGGTPSQLAMSVINLKCSQR